MRLMQPRSNFGVFGVNEICKIDRQSTMLPISADKMMAEANVDSIITSHNSLFSSAPSMILFLSNVPAMLLLLIIFFQVFSIRSFFIFFFSDQTRGLTVYNAFIAQFNLFITKLMFIPSFCHHIHDTLFDFCRQHSNFVLLISNPV